MSPTRSLGAPFVLTIVILSGCLGGFAGNSAPAIADEPSSFERYTATPELQGAAAVAMGNGSLGVVGNVPLRNGSADRRHGAAFVVTENGSISWQHELPGRQFAVHGAAVGEDDVSRRPGGLVAIAVNGTRDRYQLRPNVSRSVVDFSASGHSTLWRGTADRVDAVEAVSGGVVMAGARNAASEPDDEMWFRRIASNGTVLRNSSYPAVQSATFGTHGTIPITPDQVVAADEGYLAMADHDVVSQTLPPKGPDAGLVALDHDLDVVWQDTYNPSADLSNAIRFNDALVTEAYELVAGSGAVGPVVMAIEPDDGAVRWTQLWDGSTGAVHELVAVEEGYVAVGERDDALWLASITGDGTVIDESSVEMVGDVAVLEATNSGNVVRVVGLSDRPPRIFGEGETRGAELRPSQPSSGSGDAGDQLWSMTFELAD